MINNNYIEMILPEGILTYFEVTEFKKEESSFRVYLSEINLPPEEYSDHKLTSKGFYDEAIVQDFPIRGKAFFLHIKRRRWQDETTGNIVMRNWNLVAKGTRMTQEFAIFLKALSRYKTS
jgi:hypothetical protein